MLKKIIFTEPKFFRNFCYFLRNPMNKNVESMKFFFMDQQY